MSRRVDFAEYLKSLCASVGDFQGNGNSGISVVCDAEPLALDLEVVTALGTAVTELISNSYRHAFPTGSAGVIAVGLHRSGDKTAILSIADDGQGFDGTETDERHGVKLVNRLMGHIKGSAEVHSAKGTTWSLTFPCDSEGTESVVA